MSVNAEPTAAAVALHLSLKVTTELLALVRKLPATNRNSQVLWRLAKAVVLLGEDIEDEMVARCGALIHAIPGIHEEVVADFCDEFGCSEARAIEILCSRESLVEAGLVG